MQIDLVIAHFGRGSSREPKDFLHEWIENEFVRLNFPAIESTSRIRTLVNPCALPLTHTGSLSDRITPGRRRIFFHRVLKRDRSRWSCRGTDLGRRCMSEGKAR